MSLPPAHLTNLRRPASLRLATGLAVAGAIGAAIMAVAHMGVDLPLLPTQGLGRAVPPAAIAFTVGTLVFAAVAWGLRSCARWAWWLGLVANALALQGSALPYRGAGSAVGIALSAAALILLLLPSSRRSIS